MKSEIDTIKITMSLEDAKDFASEMHSLMMHFENAVRANGIDVSFGDIMSDHPTAAKFLSLIRAYESPNNGELPF